MKDANTAWDRRYAHEPPVKQPTIFEYSSKTHAWAVRAKQLRKAIPVPASVVYALPYVAHALGYSMDTILAFERGYDRYGKALPSKKWKRYMWALTGLYWVRANGQEAWWEDAEGDARVQARLAAPRHRKAGQKGRQGHKPKAGNRHRFK